MDGSKEMRRESIRNFRMPSYTEIPDVGLYLEQATRFAAEYLKPLECISITGSMISNYVKKKLVKNPVKKMYYRDQIAVILFIAVAKTVISLDEIRILLNLQDDGDDCKVIYEYFCDELEQALAYVFEERESMDPIEGERRQQKILLRNVVVAVAHQVYLDHSFKALSES